MWMIGSNDVWIVDVFGGNAGRGSESGGQGVSRWKQRPQPIPSAPTNVKGRQRLLLDQCMLGSVLSDEGLAAMWFAVKNGAA